MGAAERRQENAASRLIPRDIHDRTVQKALRTRFETGSPSQTLKEVLDAKRRRKREQLAVVKAKVKIAHDNTGFEKYDITWARNKAIAGLSGILSKETTEQLSNTLELAEPEKIYEYTPSSFYAELRTSEMKYKLSQLKPKLPTEAAIPEIIDSLIYLGFPINPNVLEHMHPDDILAFANFSLSSNPDGLTRIIEELNPYFFVRATEPVQHQLHSKRLVANRSTPEIAAWKELAKREQQGGPILTPEQRKVLDSVSHIVRLTGGKGFTQDADDIQSVFGLSDFFSFGKQWQQTARLFDELYTADPNLFTKLTNHEQFQTLLRTLVLDKRVQLITDILDAQFTQGVPADFASSATGLAQLFLENPSDIQQGLTNWATEFIDHATFSEQEKSFWQTAVQLSFPSFPELYDTFMTQKDRWLADQQIHRGIILETWKSAKESRNIVIDSGDAVIKLLENVGPSSDLVKSLALADIAAAIELKQLTGRTDVEVASRRLPKILGKYKYLLSTDPSVRFLLNYAIQHLPFGIGQQAVEDMRVRALQIETDAQKNLSISRFGENPFDWLHQATHNFLNPLNFELLNAFLEYLKTGNNQQIQDLLQKEDPTAVDLQLVDQQTLLFNPRTHPGQALLNLSAQERQHILKTYGTTIEQIRDDMAEMYKPKIDTLLRRLDAAQPYLNLYPNDRPQIEQALRGLQKMEEFQQAILDGKYPDNIDAVAIIQQVCAAREIIQKHLVKGLTPEDQKNLPSVTKLRTYFRDNNIEARFPDQDYYTPIVFATLMSIDQRLDMAAGLLFSSGHRQILTALNPEKTTISHDEVHQTASFIHSMIVFLRQSGIDLPRDEAFKAIESIASNAHRSQTKTQFALSQTDIAAEFAILGYNETLLRINDMLATHIAESAYVAAIHKLTAEGTTLDAQQRTKLMQDKIKDAIHEKIINVYKVTSLYPIVTSLETLVELMDITIKHLNTGRVELTLDLSERIAQATALYQELTNTGTLSSSETDRIFGPNCRITANDFSDLQTLRDKLNNLETHTTRRALELFRLMEGEESLSKDLTARGIEIISMNGLDMLVMRDANGELITDPYEELTKYYRNKGYTFVPAMHHFLRERGG